MRRQQSSSYGIPLLLLHVTIEGRPHSSARELRGDGLKITPKDGMKEIVEQRKQKEGQDFFKILKISTATQQFTKSTFLGCDFLQILISIFHFVKNSNVARIARLLFDEESLFVLVVHVSNLWNHFSAHDKYYVPNNFYHEWVFPLNFFEPRVERAEQESLP